MSPTESSPQTPKPGCTAALLRHRSPAPPRRANAPGTSPKRKGQRAPDSGALRFGAQGAGPGHHREGATAFLERLGRSLVTHFRPPRGAASSGGESASSAGEWHCGWRGGTLALCALGVPFRPGRSWVAQPWSREQGAGRRPLSDSRFEPGGRTRSVPWAAKPRTAGERRCWLSGRCVGAAGGRDVGRGDAARRGSHESFDTLRSRRRLHRGWVACARAPDMGSCSEAPGGEEAGPLRPPAREQKQPASGRRCPPTGAVSVPRGDRAPRSICGVTAAREGCYNVTSDLFSPRIHCKQLRHC